MRWLNRDPIEERGGFNLYRFLNNNPLNVLDVYGLGIWSFSAHWVQETESVYVEVTYALDDKESKCCNAAVIDRYVRKFLGTGGTFGTYVLDHAAEGGFSGMVDEQTIAYAEGDAPDGLGIGWPWANEPNYRFPWTQTFKWRVRCISGPWSGKILSERVRKYHTTGHRQGAPYTGTFH
jgi:hypothetical protein